MSVQVDGKKEPAFVRYIGTTSFEGGMWVGVELTMPIGKNAGEVKVGMHVSVHVSVFVSACVCLCVCLELKFSGSVVLQMLTVVWHVCTT